MPKLPQKVQKKVAKAEARSGDFEPYPAGKYIATLASVEARQNNSGNPMWVAEFSDITSLAGDAMPGRLWYNLNLPLDKMPEDYEPRRLRKGQTKEDAFEASQEAASGRLKGFFAAFGFSEDSDTDEMLDEKALLTVGVRTIQQGERAGTKVNTVNGILPIPEDVDLGALGGEEEDDF